MKKSLLFAALLIISIGLFSQTEPTAVAFVSYWSIGDSYDYKISKTEEQWKKGEVTKEEKQEYIANFTVIDSTESSYTISWSYKNELMNNYDIPEELSDRFEKYEMTEIRYKTSEVGDLVEILNWEEVGEIMNNMFDDMVDVLGEGDREKEKVLNAGFQPFKQIFSSREGVEQLVLKELQYFHFPLGVEFEVADPVFYDEELPNMFGGRPIKAKAKLYFEDVEFDENFCVLKQEMDMDPDDTKNVLNQVFKKMGLGGKDMKKALKTAVFEIKDRNTYEYFYYPGIPHKIEAVREINMDIVSEKVKRIDRTVIELVYEE